MGVLRTRCGAMPGWATGGRAGGRVHRRSAASCLARCAHCDPLMLLFVKRLGCRCSCWWGRSFWGAGFLWFAVGALMPTRFQGPPGTTLRSEEHTSELQSRGHLVCRLLLEK